MGHRLGNHLSEIIPLFLRFIGDPSDEVEGSDELRESCFPGLEAAVSRCTREVRTFLPDVLRVAMGFVKYDPNYCYVDDNDNNNDDNEMEMDDDNMHELMAGEDNEEDDDDVTWKVRKAAVKVVTAVVGGVGGEALLHLLFDTGYAEQLVRRFREREVNVLIDILHCFIALITTCGATPVCQQVVQAAHTLRSLLLAESYLVLRTSSSSVVKGLVLKSMSVFSKVTKEYGGLGGGHLGTNMVAHVGMCLKDSNQNLKLEALGFVHGFLSDHDPIDSYPLINQLLPDVVNLVNNEWFRAAADALRVLGIVAQVIRPKDPISDVFINNNNNTFSFPYKSTADVLLQAILPRLAATDIDQEIKTCAIAAVGIVFSHLGDCLNSALPRVLSILQKRLDNETTRIAALKAITSTISSISCISICIIIGVVLLVFVLLVFVLLVDVLLVVVLLLFVVLLVIVLLVIVFVLLFVVLLVIVLIVVVLLVILVFIVLVVVLLVIVLLVVVLFFGLVL